MRELKNSTHCALFIDNGMHLLFCQIPTHHTLHLRHIKSILLNTAFFIEIVYAIDDLSTGSRAHPHARLLTPSTFSLTACSLAYSKDQRDNYVTVAKINRVFFAIDFFPSLPKTGTSISAHSQIVRNGV